MTRAFMRHHRWRAVSFLLACGLVAIGRLPTATAEGPYTLAENGQPGALRQVSIVFQVGGELLIMADKEKEEQKLPMTVDALVRYQEKLVDAAAATDGVARCVRYCDRAEVKIKVDDRPITPSLRPDRRLLSVSLHNGQLQMFSPSGPLTREELDLIDLPGDSLVLGGLLPKSPVRPGDKWQPSDSTLGALLGLDAVGQSQVSAMLFEVDRGRARIDLSGAVHGAVGGVASHIELKARGFYSLDAHRLEDLELIYKEIRAIGHAAPGANVTARLRLRIAPLQSSEKLSAAALSGVSLAPTPERLRLQYEGAQRRFRLLHDPLWFVAREDSTSTVLRCVDRGELVAQCNVTALTPLAKDRRTTLAKFQEDVQKSLGDHFGQLVGATENQDKSGRLVYRVEATGEVADLPIQWIYYLVQDAEGRRTTAIFTLEESLERKFAHADQPLMANLVMLSAPDGSEGSPTAAPAAAATSDKSAPKTTQVEKSIKHPTAGDAAAKTYSGSASSTAPSEKPAPSAGRLERPVLRR